MKTPSEIAVDKYVENVNYRNKIREDKRNEMIREKFPNARIEGEKLHYDSIVLVPYYDSYFYETYGFHEVEGYTYEIKDEIDLGRFIINKPEIDKRRAHDKKIWKRIKFVFFSFIFIVISIFTYSLLFLKK